MVLPCENPTFKPQALAVTPGARTRNGHVGVLATAKRVPGADANPYLAIAASLVCGYLGIMEQIDPTPMVEGNAYKQACTLPRILDAALELFADCKPVRALLGDAFFKAFALIKESELDAYQGVISSWERDHLLLKV